MMDDVTRRQAMKLAATAGATTAGVVALGADAALALDEAKETRKANPEEPRVFCRPTIRTSKEVEEAKAKQPKEDKVEGYKGREQKTTLTERGFYTVKGNTFYFKEDIAKWVWWSNTNNSSSYCDASGYWGIPNNLLKSALRQGFCASNTPSPDLPFWDIDIWDS